MRLPLLLAERNTEHHRTAPNITEQHRTSPNSTEHHLQEIMMPNRQTPFIRSVVLRDYILHETPAEYYITPDKAGLYIRAAITECGFAVTIDEQTLAISVHNPQTGHLIAELFDRSH
jgi:hypothetical protein